MALSLASVVSKPTHKPPRITVYGVPGVGKTTFAASAPAPIFILTEDGMGSIEADHFPLARSYQDVIDALMCLAEEDHSFKTVVLDSLDWFETHVHAQTCKANGWKDLETPGYGRGYVAALDAWKNYIDAINYLRDERDMTIIQIAHSETVRFDSPETEPYSRYTLKLHKRAGALIAEHSDCLAFANFRTSVVKTDTGFNKKVVRGVGSGERFLFLSERPAYTAKNRYSLPDSIPMDWDAFASPIPYFNQQAAE